MGKVSVEDNDTNEKKKEFNLVRVKGTWKRKLGKKVSNDTVDCVSAAKIYESITENGTSWTVVSPIVFTYKVTETRNLLDPSNDTLLLGHITDPKQLEDIKKSHKMALMKHGGLFELLETHGRMLLDTKFQADNSVYGCNCLQVASQATHIAIVTMLEELAPNLWEDDLNRLVDFGHLISPALEMKVLPSLLHGEAVNIDMSYMVYVSKESGLLTEDEKQRIISCMVGLELPVWHEACTMELIQKSLQDRLKHSGGLVRMPLPIGLGEAEIYNEASCEILHRAYAKWCDELSVSADRNCDS